MTNRITPQKLSQLLNARRMEVSALMQRYRLQGPVNPQTIYQGASKYGQTFLTDLAAVLANPAGSDRQQYLAGASVTTVNPTPSTTTPPTTTPADNTNGWDFFSGLVDTIANIYQDQQGGSTTPTQPVVVQTTSQGISTQTILLIVGALAALVIIVLVLKK